MSIGLIVADASPSNVLIVTVSSLSTCLVVATSSKSCDFSVVISSLSTGMLVTKSLLSIDLIVATSSLSSGKLVISSLSSGWIVVTSALSVGLAVVTSSLSVFSVVCILSCSNLTVALSSITTGLIVASWSESNGLLVEISSLSTGLMVVIIEVLSSSSFWLVLVDCGVTESCFSSSKSGLIVVKAPVIPSWWVLSVVSSFTSVTWSTAPIKCGTSSVIIVTSVSFIEVSVTAGLCSSISLIFTAGYSDDSVTKSDSSWEWIGFSDSSVALSITPSSVTGTSCFSTISTSDGNLSVDEFNSASELSLTVVISAVLSNLLVVFSVSSPIGFLTSDSDKTSDFSVVFTSSLSKVVVTDSIFSVADGSFLSATIESSIGRTGMSGCDGFSDECNGLSRSVCAVIVSVFSVAVSSCDWSDVLLVVSLDSSEYDFSVVLSKELL